eukprot:2300910-Prymnesium_polylepis.1
MRKTILSRLFRTATGTGMFSIKSTVLAALTIDCAKLERARHALSLSPRPAPTDRAALDAPLPTSGAAPSGCTQERQGSWSRRRARPRRRAPPPGTGSSRRCCSARSTVRAGGTVRGHASARRPHAPREDVPTRPRVRRRSKAEHVRKGEW